MKTVFFTIAILLSFTNINAQATVDTRTDDITVEASKADFFKALVEKNNFDITIKEDNNVVASNTKTDFYNLLIEKNNFDITINNNVNSTFAHIDNNTSTDINAAPVATLVP